MAFAADGTRLAVAHAVMQFQQQPQGMPLSSYIWDINVPTQPALELAPQSQVTCISFNGKDANLIGGGLYNGQFAVFDMRTGGSVVEATPLERSHR